MRAALVLAVLLVGGGCVSDQKLVANATAARHYHHGRWERECEGKETPPCEAFAQLVDEALDETELCNEVQRIGKLPPQARRRLKQLTARMEKQP
jgi:hypothetical protein